eukprot:366421-Chlamydomonas_euryale.AAC.3
MCLATRRLTQLLQVLASRVQGVGFETFDAAAASAGCHLHATNPHARFTPVIPTHAQVAKCLATRHSRRRPRVPASMSAQALSATPALATPTWGSATRR